MFEKKATHSHAKSIYIFYKIPNRFAAYIWEQKKNNITSRRRYSYIWNAQHGYMERRGNIHINAEYNGRHK